MAAQAVSRRFQRYATSKPLRNNPLLRTSSHPHILTYFSTNTWSRISPHASTSSSFPSYIPPRVQEIREDAAIQAARRIERKEVLVFDKPVQASFIGPSQSRSTDDTHHRKTNIVMLHGFDSSCLEFRRLIQALEGRSDAVAVYAVDILGWGFCEADDSIDYSPLSKREYLKQFISNNVGDKVVLIGCSLGGACAIDFAVHHRDLVDGLVLIDAQGYIDGLGQMSTMPDLFLKAGLYVLRSWPLRNYANNISYFDKDKFATDDAVRIGRLHCFTKDWIKATMRFMKSGGYQISESIPKVSQKTLILWGDADNILSASYAEKFANDIDNSSIEWIEKAGHVPHLEKPLRVADAVLNFFAIEKKM